MSQIIDDDKVKDFFRFQTQRRIINLYKNYLVLLEDFKSPPYNIPEESYSKIRKRILDMGNDVIREMEEDFKKVSISLK